MGRAAKMALEMPDGRFAKPACVGPLIRIVVVPTKLPIGIVTALLGGLFSLSGGERQRVQLTRALARISEAGDSR
jgi:ABC-type multidrug transport system fused ATPase/permease subunit